MATWNWIFLFRWILEWTGSLRQLKVETRTCQKQMKYSAIYWEKLLAPHSVNSGCAENASIPLVQRARAYFISPPSFYKQWASKADNKMKGETFILIALSFSFLFYKMERKIPTWLTHYMSGRIKWSHWYEPALENSKYHINRKHTVHERPASKPYKNKVLPWNSLGISSIMEGSH